MTEQPDVTIVIPVGGAAAACGLPGLRRSLDSIGGDPQAEIVAVLHDHAPAGAAAWLAARAAADPRLVVLGEEWIDRGDAAGGLAWARNLGIAAAAAPLVAFLDPDDVWLPGKLGAQRALHAGHPELGFSFTDCRRIGVIGEDGGGSFARWPRFHARHGGRTTPFLLGADALAQLYAEDVVIASTVVARTDLLRGVHGFAPDLAASEWDLWLRLAARAPVACRPAASVEARLPGAADAALETLVALELIADRHARALRRQEPSRFVAALRRRAVSASRPA